MTLIKGAPRATTMTIWPTVIPAADAVASEMEFRRHLPIKLCCACITEPCSSGRLDIKCLKNVACFFKPSYNAS
ncbi:hypothetical protein F5Y09DRAFT_303706 [Xylaria sp. FL1042]|nr:hypothetical protein F5Y09DRAFT_303706 [Xylaria sp. FL1042]